MADAAPPSLEKTSATLLRAERRGAKRSFLVVLSGPQFGEVFDLEAGREALIGRSEEAAIRLYDGGVSRRHALVTASEEGARLVDLGSANGTFVEGARVSDVSLCDGMRIQVGAHTTMKLVHSDAADAHHQRELAAGALHEPLTGLAGRRHFAERLASELAGAQRHGRPLALLVVDVDHLRTINSRFGPLAGDEALRVVASVLQGAVRKEDVLARYGGEEFAIVARETGLTGARALAERVRKAVARARCAHEGSLVPLTVSIGVAVTAGLAQFEPGRGDADLVLAAERALARAKQNGRNAVVAAPALGS
jgi:two-component system cell cycle response regulator